MSSEQSVLSRRRFLGYTAAAGTGLVAGSATSRLAFADPNDPAAGDVLVVVFLRGGADGLSLVAPYGEPTYIAERPTIAVPPPDQVNGALDLDGFFGLHPSLDALYDTAWTAGNLAVVHAAGLTDSSTRSHFEAQQFWERSSTSQAVRTGWLARLLAAAGLAGGLPGVGMSSSLPLSLAGLRDAVAINSIDSFEVAGFPRTGATEATLASLYGSDQGLLGSVGVELLQAVDLVRAAAPGQIPVANGAVYPDGNRIGEDLAEVAQLIRANVGLRAAVISVGGWDMHDDMGGTGGGDMSTRAGLLGDALAAFHTDLGADMSEVSVVTMSEFGRTTKENGSGGTDHGRGNVMFVMGGGINGGVYADWPGVEERDDGRDLRVTVDFRTVLAELVDRRFGGADLARVFPGYSVPGYLGLATG